MVLGDVRLHITYCISYHQSSKRRRRRENKLTEKQDSDPNHRVVHRPYQCHMAVRPKACVNVTVGGVAYSSRGTLFVAAGRSLSLT